MGDNTEYYELDSDIDTILDTSETIEEVVETPEKKNRVNFQYQRNFKSKKKSFVWSYFQEENGNDVCKILISVNGKETTCGKSYKHDGSTGNMKQHLQVKHGILESEELHTGLEKYTQPKIDNIFKKIIPHSSSKQKELKKITAEWLITDSLPFNVVNKKGYLKMMKTIDPAFNPPSSKSIKSSLAVAYNKGVLQLKELLSRTCETASITTDLWTSRSNDGYIGVTLHWLSPDFEVYDAILAVEKIEYPHTGERIKEYLNAKVEEFELSGKIVCAITDNGKNMKKAIRIWDVVEHISCSAHTLQLTVFHTLKYIKPYTKRIRKLVKFFKSSKQSQRLDQAQIDLAQRNNVTTAPIQLHGSENLIELEMEENIESENVDMEFKVLRTISEIKTRWNSSFLSWQRLLKLRTAIEWLSLTLHLLEDDGAKEDSRKLNNYKLDENEWELLEGLVMLFKPFDELTTYFSGIKYATLSVVNPSIETLKFEFAGGDLLDSHELNEIFNDNETENLGFDEGNYFSIKPFFLIKN
jgi:hypothetical protein